MNAAPPPLFPIVPERIAEIIFALCQTVSMRLRMRTMSPAQLTYIVGRLLGIRRRFQLLVARIRAGQLPRERARTPRLEAAKAVEEFPLGFRPPPPGWRRWAVRADKPVPLWQSLRQNFAWLLPLAPNVPEFRDSAAGLRTRLLDLLAEPDIRALLLASRRVGDSLRPLCWMLGIEASVLYPARPNAARPGAGAVDDSCADAVSPAPSADDQRPDPVTAEIFARVVATQPVAAMEPMIRDVIEPAAGRPRAREGGDVFAAA